MKQTGHSSFRTSTQWSHLIPGESGIINEEVVRFYHRYFNGLIENGIEPFVSLYHFDMPMYLQEKGGWLSRGTVEAYKRYTRSCFELFSSKVEKWFTHNEPIVPVEAGYLYRWHYPEESDMEKAIQVGCREALTSALAVKSYYEMEQGGVIGIILNLTPSCPRDESNPEDVRAAQIADAFFNRSFLDPTVEGEFPSELIEIMKELDLMPVIHPEDLTVIKENTVDLLGINYYQPRQVKVRGTPINTKNGPMPEDHFNNYEMPGRKINPYHRWEIYEQGIYDILINVRDHYGDISCFISENGMGVENEARFIKGGDMIHDDYRIEFIQSHLRYVHQATQEGADCLDYHMWTCMDNWSWADTYKNWYSLISVDLAQDGKRTIKKSGHWFKDTSDKNGLET